MNTYDKQANELAINEILNTGNPSDTAVGVADPRDARIAELEAALQELTEAIEPLSNDGYVIGFEESLATARRVLYPEEVAK